jgi:hypothetical protein
MRAASSASLATVSDGQPAVSLVTPAIAPDGAVLLWLSALSEHTRQLSRDPRCSLLFQGVPEGPNPQTAPRVTVTGLAERIEDAELKSRWLARHPYAALYAEFGDFFLWRIVPQGGLAVLGFGRAHRLRAADLRPIEGEEDFTPNPSPEYVGQVDVQVAAPQVIGAGPMGERRVIPILGGQVTGPRLEGEVLPGGADFQLIRPDGVAEIEARYTIRLTNGALVYVVNRGLRHAAPEDMARLLRGEPVPPSRVYFRTTPVFETPDPDHAWLTRSLFLGLGERMPEAVRIRIFTL